VRRGRLAVIGLCLLLGGAVAAGLGLSDRWRNVNWYSHVPTGWVISDLKSRDGATRDRAWAELSARLGRGELSESQQAGLDAAAVGIMGRDGSAMPDPLLKHLVGRFDKLTPPQRDATFARLLADAGSTSYVVASAAQDRITALMKAGQLLDGHVNTLTEAALAAQAAPARGNATEWMLDFLGRRAAEQKLSDARRNKFFEQAMPPKLTVRPDMIAGESVPFWVRFGGRAPKDDEGWYSRDSMISFQIDDEKPQPQGSYGAGNGLSLGGTGSSARVKRPGEHVLKVTLETATFRGNKHPDRDTPPFWSRTITLTAPFKALPNDTRDYITLRDEPERADAIRRAVKIDQVRSKRTGLDRLAMNVQVSRPPVNVSFDVIARHAGKEYLLGGVYCNAGEDNGAFGPYTDKFPLGVAKVDVILRSSEKVARGTVDLYEIWKGELVFPDLPVKAE
jgi:hypothetical protein